ncbi:hypothetical protein [Vulcanisaeta sp. JCM 14467]|nr:hypothetical protein [Vulcanisaeta sp. JCM 14467]
MGLGCARVVQTAAARPGPCRGEPDGGKPPPGRAAMWCLGT